MDALFELFAPLIGHWRVMIATLAALLVAVVLTILFASFTGDYGIGLVLLGLGAGMLWEADASRAKGGGSGRPDA